MAVQTGLYRFITPELFFGEGVRFETASLLKKLGVHRVLIVSDPGVISSGWTGELMDSLSGSGIRFSLFSEVTPNPKADEVMQGVSFYRDEGCDGIVVLGGGSPIDCAKGIAIVSANGGHILDYEGVDQISKPIPPFIALPTTSGSSADMSRFAIISDTAVRVKKAIISSRIVPDYSLLDPEVTMTMDPYLTACTGMDALTHAIEALVSSGHSPLTDVHAKEAIRLVYRNLKAAAIDRLNIHIRAQVMMASLQAGLAFSNAGLGAVHAMAHSLGGLKDLSHGECNALLLEHVINHNYDSAVHRYSMVAEAMELDIRGKSDQWIRQALLERVSAFRQEVGVVSRLADLGIQAADIPRLAENSVKDACLSTNPQTISKKQMENLFYSILSQGE